LDGPVVWLAQRVFSGRGPGKCGPGPLQGAVDRRHRGVQLCGDLRRAELQHVPQHEDGPLSRRQQLHGRDQGEPHTVSLGCARLGIRLVTKQVAAGQGLQPGHLEVRHERAVRVVARRAEARGHGRRARPSSAVRQAFVAIR